VASLQQDNSPQLLDGKCRRSCADQLVKAGDVEGTGPTGTQAQPTPTRPGIRTDAGVCSL
jgi:hypothetical protein